MQTLKFLGRGSAFNVKEGNTSAYIKDGSTLLLIDCGETVLGKILEKNILEGVKDIYVLITHLHSDHIGSLSTFIYYCFYKLNLRPKVIFPNADVHNFLQACGHDGECDCIWVNGNYVIDKNISFTPIQVSHMKSMSCYGYLINYKGKSIYYSGDSNEIKPIVLKFLHDDVIHEFYQDVSSIGGVHLKFESLLQIMNHKRKNVYCMHLDSDELVEKANMFGFNVVNCE